MRRPTIFSDFKKDAGIHAVPARTVTKKPWSSVIDLRIALSFGRLNESFCVGPSLTKIGTLETSAAERIRPN